MIENINELSGLSEMIENINELSGLSELYSADLFKEWYYDLKNNKPSPKEYAYFNEAHFTNVDNGEFRRFNDRWNSLKKKRNISNFIIENRSGRYLSFC